MGKLRTYPSEAAMRDWEEKKLKAIRELQEDGYTILDPYGRAIIF